MIQLPTKIRTTFFNAFVEPTPYQLFSHEDDRLLAVIYNSYSAFTTVAFGRSEQDVLNSDMPVAMNSNALYIYGPEPIYIGYPTIGGRYSPGRVIVQGIYRA